MFALPTILSLLTKIPAALAKGKEFKEVFGQIKSTFGTKDQATLQAAYADLIAENDEGHQRLQDKLREAARRP